MRLITIILSLGLAGAFAPLLSTPQSPPTSLLSTTSSDVSLDIALMDPKEAVKLFGRLAEKYIMLDESGGMCCYSGCSDCEYRLPGGGYKMADQSASRPKWIPVYEERKFASQGKQHAAKWATEIFANGPSVTKEEFLAAMVGMSYAPPLGGPYVSASAGKLEDTTAAGKLFDLLAGGKEKLARFYMSVRLKELAGGTEQGLTWPAFQEAMGCL
jgi:hypothetical protein